MTKRRVTPNAVVVILLLLLVAVTAILAIFAPQWRVIPGETAPQQYAGTEDPPQSFNSLAHWEASITIPPESDNPGDDEDLSQHVFIPAIHVQNVNQDFWKRRILWFQGRSSKDTGPLIFHRQSIGSDSSPMTWTTTRPQLYASPSFAAVTSDDATKDVPLEYAQVWYGEAIVDESLADQQDSWSRSSSVGSGVLVASFVMDAKGQVYGSISDGVDSYTFTSTLVTNPEASTSSSSSTYYEHFYSVSSISNSPDEALEDNEETTDPSNRGLLDRERKDSLLFSAMSSSGTLRGGVEQKQTPGFQRMLQTDPVPQNKTKGVVDVAVIYTEEAKIAEGGDAAIHNMIGLGVFQTNTAFANSGSDIRVRLVQTVQDTSFPDNATINAWDAVLANDDGYFDYWDQVQNETGADAIMVLVNRYPRFCGRAQNGGPLALISRGCAVKAGRFSFAHELGHWFSAGHDSTSDADFDNRGYIDQVNCFRTLMAYQNCDECSSCPRVLYYSNNRTTTPQGYSVGTTERENNLRIMEDKALDVENFVQSYSTQLPIGLCREDPCEEAPVFISDLYNGTGRSAYIPGDNLVSSITIPEGLAVEVFDEANYQGVARFFGNSYSSSSGDGTTNIASISLEDFDLDNRIGSIVIRTIPKDEGVILCGTFFCSNKFGSSSSTTENGRWVESVGSYRVISPEIGEGNLARILLPFGWKIRLFEERDFLGESIEFINSATESASLSTLTHLNRPDGALMSVMFRGRYKDWNNRARSMIIGLV